MIRRIGAQLVLPAAALVLALITGAVFIVLSSPLVEGHLDVALPLDAYGALVSGSLLSPNGWIDTLVNATPLILGGLSVGLCFKAGLFNIGAQGQTLIGALAAAAAAGALASQPAPIAIVGSLVAGLLAGMLYGFIPGALKAFTGAHEVVTTIMLNYVAIYVIAWAITGPLLAPGASFARSADVGNAKLPDLIGTAGHQLHAGVVLALITIPIAWWVLNRSTIGFEVRTVGANPDAARYAGMRPRLLTIGALTVGGGLAGLAGTIEILGVAGYMPAAYATNIGFDAITVALIGRANPIGILFGALLLGALRAGAASMQIKAGIPVEMVDILQGVMLFFLSADLIVRWVFRLRRVDGGVDELATVSRSYGGQTSVT
ncbi:MAG TPA: ABC transporter permease [Candidatus Limnocylindrales bacterium]|nr:ABC transporter permease [Candidatus Limnocylindrales bacterium]